MITQTNRRDFLKISAGLMTTAGVGATALGDTQPQLPGARPGSGEARRKELWSLLGDLPWKHRPAAPRLLKTEKHDGYALERLVLDLNGEEEVPALLLIPEKLKRVPIGRQSHCRRINGIRARRRSRREKERESPYRTARPPRG